MGETILVIMQNFVTPFVVALTTYLLFKRLDEWGNRRKQSKLGVAIIDVLMEEVKTGFLIMDQCERTQKIPDANLPKAGWSGVNTISDEVLLRIIETSENVVPASFPPKDIRIHCKNYFEHMTVTWNRLTLGDIFSINIANGLIHESNFKNSTDGVYKMLEQARGLLLVNSKKWFPK